ncbi:MAG: MFS transporter [Gammaproteobacteria bacterium PRO9]|nr:MFS transporter [Gammaproteobacteria bacterium PRO9]
MTTKEGSFYYGWIIAVSAALILVVTNGMTLSGLNVFDRPLLDALKDAAGAPVSLADYKLRDAITLAAAGLMAPFAGAAADRFGVRPLMIIGVLLLSAGYFLYSKVDSLGDIYAIHVLFASALASCGLLVCVLLVSRWFIKDRGLALGIMVAGTSLGNGTLPPLNALLLESVGWQASFAWLSLLPLCLIPLILFVVRERPADLDRQMPAAQASGAAPANITSLTLGMAIRSANFWILALIAMFTFFAIIGTSAHLNLYMLKRGFSQTEAGLSYTVLFYLGLIGKIASGFLADRLGRQRIFVGTLTTMAVGAGILLLPGVDAIWAGLVCFGLGWGGLYTLLQLLAADYFGPRHLGKILGGITVLDTLGGGLGPAMIGAIYDRTGSYDQALMLVAGLIVAALLLATQFRMGRPAPGQAPRAAAAG